MLEMRIAAERAGISRKSRDSLCGVLILTTEDTEDTAHSSLLKNQIWVMQRRKDFQGREVPLRLCVFA